MTKAALLKKKPRAAKVFVVLDDDLVLERELAAQELEAARGNGHKPDELDALEAVVTRLDAAIEKATSVMTFRAMGGKAYADLLEANPPTPDQVERARTEQRDRQAELPERERLPFMPPAFDRDTFPVALVAASLVDPVLTIEEVATLRHDWNADEWSALFVTALDVNTTARRH